MKLKGMDSSMLGRPKSKLRASNPIAPNQGYVYHNPLFSWYAFKATAARAQTAKLNLQAAFAIANGQQYLPGNGTAFALTDFHTNLYGQGGILPEPERYLVRAISIAPWENWDVADAIQFAHLALIILYIGSGKSAEYWRSHAFRTPCGGGVFGFSSAVISNGVPLVDNQPGMWGPNVDPQTGQYVPNNQYGVDNCEVIEAGQNFNVTIDPTQGTDASGNTTYGPLQDINVHVYLDGIRVRAVQ